MGKLREYGHLLLPPYMQQKVYQDHIDAFAEVLEEQEADVRQARVDGDVMTCTPDVFDYHYDNLHLLRSPWDNDAQVRAHLKSVWKIWAKGGTYELILDELKHFGYPNAKIVTWTDLVLAGVPKPFGGNFLKVPGLTVDGDMYYLPLEPGWTIEHRNAGPNLPLSVYIDTHFRILRIQMQTDGTGFVTCTANDIVKALTLRSDELLQSVYFGTRGNGTGYSLAFPVTQPDFSYFSYFFIDLGESINIKETIRWDVGEYATTEYPIGTMVRSWHAFENQPPVTVGNQGNVETVFGTAINNIWVRMRKETSLQRWQGASWQSIPVTGLSSDAVANQMFGTSATDIWTAMRPANLTETGGYLLHWDGSTVTKSFLPNVFVPGNWFNTLGVWGTNASNMWCCGVEQDNMVTMQIAHIFYWNGSTWTEQTLPGGITYLQSIWGSSATDIWACYGTTLLHFNGTSWSVSATPTFGMTDSVNAVWGGAANDVWLAGRTLTPSFAIKLWHWNGTTWSVFATAGTGTANNTIYSIIGTSTSNVYFFSSDGIFYWDGATLTYNKGPIIPGLGFLSGIFWFPTVLQNNDLMISSDQGLFINQQRVDLQPVLASTPGWTANFPVGASAAATMALHGLSKDYVWTTNADLNNAAFYDGVTKTWTLRTHGLNQYMQAVYCFNQNNVWFVGSNGKAARWNGTSFDILPIPGAHDYLDVWAAGPNEVYAVGMFGRLAIWDGATWTVQALFFPGAIPDPTLYAISGVARASAKAKIVFGGEDGNICFYDVQAGTYSYSTGIPLQTIRDIYMGSEGYAYTVGNQNTINYTKNGGVTWVNTSIPTLGTTNLISAQVYAPNNIVVITTSSRSTFDGTAWTTTTPAMGVDKWPYTAVWGPSYDEIWIGSEPTMAYPQAEPYVFKLLTTIVPSGVLSGNQWDTDKYWDFQPLTVRTLAELKTLIRRYKPFYASCRFVRFKTAELLIPYPICDEWEEDENGNVFDHYATHY